MVRKYVDYIVPETKNDLRAMLDTAHLLGYSQVWVGSQQNSLLKELVNLQKNYSLEVIQRLNIDTEQLAKEQVISILRKQRRTYPIIAIKCYDPEITGWAAQDNRIDIISFPVTLTAKLFSRSVAKLMVKFTKYLEISLSPLYVGKERTQIPIIRQLQQVIKLALLKKVPIIVNSGSTSFTQLKGPWELNALAQVLSEEKMVPLDSLSKIPYQLVNQNKLKISSDYLAPGVYKISDSEDFTREEEE